MKKIVSVIVFFVLFSLGLGIYYSSRTPAALPFEQKNTLVVVSPVKDSKISSPLSIAGRASNSWFFEGSFPITLKDSRGAVVAESHASIKGDIKEEGLIKFVGSMQFSNVSSGQSGVLIFKKGKDVDDNKDDEVYEIPIIFK